MLRWIWVGLATIAVIAALWAAGEMHKQSCIKAGNIGCQIWPWSSGHHAPAHSRYLMP